MPNATAATGGIVSAAAMKPLIGPVAASTSCDNQSFKQALICLSS
jgi:hypothetical protein